MRASAGLRAGAHKLCLAVIVVTAANFSCGGENTILPIQEPKKCNLQIASATIISSPYLNPTTTGEARPVQVRLYQLKTDARLQNASFDDVWNHDKEALADDIVKMDEVSVYPNTRSEYRFERDESALYIAAVALFRVPKGHSWFTTFEFPPAPGKGDCGMKDCEGPGCDGGGGAVLNPKYYFYVETSRIDDGSDHADEYPEGRSLQVVHLKGAGSKPNAPPGPGEPKK